MLGHSAGPMPPKPSLATKLETVPVLRRQSSRWRLRLQWPWLALGLGKRHLGHSGSDRLQLHKQPCHDYLFDGQEPTQTLHPGVAASVASAALAGPHGLHTYVLIAEDLTCQLGAPEVTLKLMQ